MDLRLHYPLEDSVEIDGAEYPLNVSFDVILRIFDMLKDPALNDPLKVKCGLIMLMGTDAYRTMEMDYEAQNGLFSDILGRYVKLEREIEYDILGNPIETLDASNDIHYDIDYDADAIYASFMQAYGMDLIDQQGKLHWLKFRALLSGLPDNTRFKRIVSIRQWREGDDKKDRKQVMREAQRALKLPDTDLEDEDENY